MSAAGGALTRALLFPVHLVTWALLFGAVGLSAVARLLQWSARTLADNAVSAMALGDPALRARLARRDL